MSQNNITFEKNKSSIAFRNLSAHAGEIDFILIDGNHKINHFVGDLRFSRYLKTGGLLLIHDYSEDFKGIKSATNLFLHRYKYYDIISHVDALLIIRKKTISTSIEISFLYRLFSHFCSFFYQFGKSLSKRLPFSFVS